MPEVCQSECGKVSAGTPLSSRARGTCSFSFCCICLMDAGFLTSDLQPKEVTSWPRASGTCRARSRAQRPKNQGHYPLAVFGFKGWSDLELSGVPRAFDLEAMLEHIQMQIRHSSGSAQDKFPFK